MSDIYFSLKDEDILKIIGFGTDSTNEEIYEKVQRANLKSNVEVNNYKIDMTSFSFGDEDENNSFKAIDRDLLNIYLSYVDNILEFDFDNPESKEKFINRYKTVNIMSDEELGEKFDIIKDIFYSDYSLIKDNEILRKPLNIDKLFNSREFKELRYKPVRPQDNNPKSRFRFIQTGMLDFNFTDISDEFRIYLCPTVENMRNLLAEILKRTFPDNACLIKYCKDEKYTDKIILYIHRKDFSKYVNIIKKIKKDYPEYFIGMQKNIFWGNINGLDGVYAGETPNYPFDKNYSYGSLRATIANKVLQKIDDKLSKEEQVEEFKYYFKLYCVMYNINPANPSINYFSDISSKLKIDSDLFIKVKDVTKEGKFIVSAEYYDEFYGNSSPFIEISYSELIDIYSGNNPMVKKDVVERLNKKLGEQEKLDFLRMCDNALISLIEDIIPYNLDHFIPSYQVDFDNKFSFHGDKRSFDFKLFYSIQTKVCMYISMVLQNMFLNFENQGFELKIQELKDEINDLDEKLYGERGVSIAQADQIIEKHRNNYSKGLINVSREELLMKINKYFSLKKEEIKNNLDFLDSNEIGQIDSIIVDLVNNKKM